jgi:hypothetical protein
MAEQHLPSYETDFYSKVQQVRGIAARFERARRHCFNSKVQRFRDIAVRFEDWTKERIRLYRIRQRRTAWIERFTEIQRRKREWINFAEIAQWCAEESCVVPNEVAREAAYKKLLNDFLDGDFEEHGRSQIMYLHPYTAKARMTREWLIHVMEVYGDQTTINSQILAHCWMRREFFEQWLAKHRMQPRPERFEPRWPMTPATKQQPVSQDRKAAMQPVTAEGVLHGAGDPPQKRPGPEPGTLRRYEAADRALFPELERIMVEKQKSRSAAALELAEADRVKGHGTAQSCAKRLAALHKRERSGTGGKPK